MSRKVLAIVSSPRKGGNSELLAQQFTNGAQDAGSTVETVFLRDKKIAPCLACEACQRTGVCVHQDGKAAMETTTRDMEGFARCIPESTVKGKLYGSAYRAGDIRNNPVMEEAYRYGENC